MNDGGDELRCRTPPLRPAKATVEVSLNAQQFLGGLDFTTFTPPRVVALSPTTKPQQAGGTLAAVGPPLLRRHGVARAPAHAAPLQVWRRRGRRLVWEWQPAQVLRGGAGAVPWRSVALHGNLPPVSAGGVSKFGFAAGVGGSPQFLTDFERFPAYSSGTPGTTTSLQSRRRRRSATRRPAFPEEFPWDEFAQFPWDDENLGARPLGAHIKDGIFLTSYEGFEAGSVLWAVEPTDQYGAHAATAFEVAFDLKVTPGATPTGIAARYFADKNSEFADTEVDMANEGLTSGDGFSFSFGDIAEGLVSERGAGRGLRVQFLTYTHNVIRVLLHGRPVASVPFTMVFNETVGVSIAVERSELTISLGATTLLAHLPLRAWEQRRRAAGVWRSARATAPPSRSTRCRRCAGSPRASTSAAPCRWRCRPTTKTTVADGVTFAYTPPLAFDEISPSTGAIGGGTPAASAPPSAAVPTTRLASARRSCPPPTATRKLPRGRRRVAGAIAAAGRRRRPDGARDDQRPAIRRRAAVWVL